MKKEIYERLQKISERLKKDHRAEKVILFRFYARVKETEESGVKLFIIAPIHEHFLCLEIIHEIL